MPKLLLKKLSQLTIFTNAPIISVVITTKNDILHKDIPHIPTNGNGYKAEIEPSDLPISHNREGRNLLEIFVNFFLLYCNLVAMW